MGRVKKRPSITTLAHDNWRVREEADLFGSFAGGCREHCRTSAGGFIQPHLYVIVLELDHTGSFGKGV